MGKVRCIEGGKDRVERREECSDIIKDIPEIMPGC